MNDYIQRRLEEFDELSTKLITRGGLSVLMDYPPHDQVLDDKAVKAFLSISIKEAIAEERKRVVGEIKGLMKLSKTEWTALDDLLSYLDKEITTNTRNMTKLYYTPPYGDSPF